MPELSRVEALGAYSDAVKKMQRERTYGTPEQRVAAFVKAKKTIDALRADQRSR